MVCGGGGGLIQSSDIPHISGGGGASQINGVASDSQQVMPSPVSPNVLQCMLQGYEDVKTIISG